MSECYGRFFLEQLDPGWIFGCDQSPPVTDITHHRPAVKPESQWRDVQLHYHEF